MTSLATLVLATEGGIPFDSPLTRLAVPAGVLIFLGLPYMLLRSNLGTRRAYLVLGTSFFGFMFVLSLFWSFGAPGTPALTGPTNLPGTVPNEYQPLWVPFAADSTVAAEEPYAALVADDGAFSPPTEEQQAEASTAVADINGFFAAALVDTGYPPRIQTTWTALDDQTGYAVAANGQPVVRAVYSATYQPNADGELPDGVTEEQVGQPIPQDEEGAGQFVAYAFFDAGNPLFPALLFLATSILGFALHAVLLHGDEQRERRERRELAEPRQEEQKVPAGV